MPQPQLLCGVLRVFWEFTGILHSGMPTREGTVLGVASVHSSVSGNWKKMGIQGHRRARVQDDGPWVPGDLGSCLQGPGEG